MAGNNQDVGMYAENQSGSLLKIVTPVSITIRRRRRRQHCKRGSVIRSCFVAPKARSYRPEAPLDHMPDFLSDFTSRQICTDTAIVASDCALMYSRKLMVVMVLIIKVDWWWWAWDSHNEASIAKYRVWYYMLTHGHWLEQPERGHWQSDCQLVFGPPFHHQSMKYPMHQGFCCRAST